MSRLEEKGLLYSIGSIVSLIGMIVFLAASASDATFFVPGFIVLMIGIGLVVLAAFIR